MAWAWARARLRLRLIGLFTATLSKFLPDIFLTELCVAGALQAPLPHDEREPLPLCEAATDGVAQPLPRRAAAAEGGVSVHSAVAAEGVHGVRLRVSCER